MPATRGFVAGAAWGIGRELALEAARSVVANGPLAGAAARCQCDRSQSR